MDQERTKTPGERGEIAKEVERKDQEMYEQERRGEKSHDKLKGYDKTDADSFPASDPPPAQSTTE